MENKEKIIISIPKEVNYISDYKEIDNLLPQNIHYILDKVVTGCGATEYFINNNQNIILASPRKVLLQNKKDQHPEVFLVKNELEKTVYDEDLEDKKKEEVEIVEDVKEILGLQEEIKDYYTNCLISNKPCKILVTYDSLKHVLSALGDSVSNFLVVVDEFQSIFTDSSFKAEVELNFVDYLQSIPSVCYLSATPMLEKYMKQLEEFKDLPYYQLSWDSSHIIKPVIYRKKVKSLGASCADFIEDYLSGKYPKKAVGDKIVESKEVVFYVNSVKEITSILKAINTRYKKENNTEDNILTPKNTNIICSDTPKNKRVLKRQGFSVGKVPLKGEKTYPFTFCTRTVYLGADFYSTNAYTVICSNANIQCLALDISLDLPQIMGRQRNRENPFRHEAVFFYKIKSILTSFEEFQKHLKEKLDSTKNILSLFLKGTELEKLQATKDRRKVIRVDRYREDFAGVREKTGELVFNTLVLLSEQRAWEVQQLNYKDDITLYNSMSDVSTVETYVSSADLEVKKFIDIFTKEVSFFTDRMKLYCEFADKWGNEKLKSHSEIDSDYHTYYDIFGSDKIKASSYQKSKLEEQLSIYKSTDKVFLKIKEKFSIGTRMIKKEIKSTIQDIYNSLGLNKKARATDLEQYFVLKRCRMTVNGKVEEAFLILSTK